MCGIIGILGEYEVAPYLLDALKRLEYRGYDSAGIATLHDGQIKRRRAVGKLVHLSDLLVHDPLSGYSGIGHTRWATHGIPSEENAHPHIAGRVAVVHNGIIENFRELREDLAQKGYHTTSQTDTEIVAMSVASFMDQQFSPKEAVLQTLKTLRGAFALCFLFEGEENLLIAARKGSPLAVAQNEKGVFVGSDAIALGGLTSQIIYLEEGDVAFLTRSQVDICDANGQSVTRSQKPIAVNETRIEKEGYRHFMVKEIHEQPKVIHNVLEHYIKDNLISFPQQVDFRNISRLTLVACGTAFYACQVAKYWFEQFAKIPVEIDIASEFRYREPPLAKDGLALFVSQSGETADTLAALRYCKEHVNKILSVVNVQESSIARESDVALPILAGVEVGVASTKAFTCQLLVLALLALQAGKDRGTLSDEDIATHLAVLYRLPGLMYQVLGQEQDIAAVAASLAEARDILFLGRGVLYPLAMEGALKLKEISYIHAEGYAAGELKHGPISLIDKMVPVIVMAPGNGLFEKTVSNMQEVAARNAQVILLTDAQGRQKTEGDQQKLIVLPEIEEVFSPILYALPAQLLAYHTAIMKGTDIDQPRNLAKSVTVE